MAENILIAGGGITGLTAAYFLKKQNPDASVSVIEREAHLGGLLRKFDYGEYGIFDCGIHNIPETGIKELDELYYQLLPEPEWEVLERERRDLGGLYLNARLQTNTVYPDLRQLDDFMLRRCIGDLFYQLNDQKSPDTFRSSHDYFINQFGDTITREIISPITQKIYGRSPKELSLLAYYLTPLERVALFNEDVISHLSQSDILRKRLAFIDQRDLPLEKASGIRCYYPKQFGIYRVIEALAAQVESMGVHIQTETSIQSVQTTGSQISSVTLQSSGDIIDKMVDRIYWSVGIPPLAFLLGLPKPAKAFDKPYKTALVNILVTHEPQMKDLFFAYVYDPHFITFRVVNYHTYCPASVRDKRYPLTVEIFVPEDQFDAAFIEKKAIAELCEMNIIKGKEHLVFCKTELLKSGFQLPTLTNMDIIDELRGSIESKGIENLHLLGMLAERDLFFQNRILRHLYNTIVINK